MPAPATEEQKATETKSTADLIADAAKTAPATIPTPVAEPPVVPPEAPVTIRESPATKWERQAKEAQARAKEAEDRAAKAEAEAKAQSNSVAEQIRGLTSTVEELRNTAREAQMREYNTQLSVYRTSVIAAYNGKIIEAMVPVGPDPNAILAGAESASKEFLRLEAAWRASQQPVTPTVVNPALPTATIAQPTPPPAPTAPPPGSFPTPPAVSAPLDASTHNPGGPDFSAYTSPEAVRNGTYAQNRTALMAAIKGQPVPTLPPPVGAPTLGTRAPAFGTPVTHPGGAQSPVSLPTPPVMRPGQHIPTPPQPPPFMGQPQVQGGGELEAARAAANRARTGTLPANVVAANRGVQNIARESASLGVSPEQAFQNRFDTSSNQ